MSDYIDEARKKFIPKGSTIPHHPSWKGRQDKKHLFEHLPIEDIDFQKKYDVGQRFKSMTHKQQLTAKYMLEGYSHKQAMIKAGYSLASANTQPLSDQKVILSFLQGIQQNFMKEGITETYVSKKMKEWMEAKKPVRNRTGEQLAEDPDYKTQLEAFKQWREIVTPRNKEDRSKKRELTITEWLNEENPTTE